MTKTAQENIAQEIILFDYPKSSASYRLRIALNLKNIPYQKNNVNLLEKYNLNKKYRAINPQGLVPVLYIDGQYLSQSLAILDYLEDIRPTPALLPMQPMERAKARAMSMAIAMEIHPICNLSVVQHVAEIAQSGNDSKTLWMKHFITKGLQNFEDILAQNPPKNFCFGNNAGIVECCLIPQLYNAHRWGVSLESMPNIQTLEERCSTLTAFINAHPDKA